MASEWRRVRGHGRVPNPEADWLSAANVHRGPCPVSIRLSRDAARFLTAEYPLRVEGSAGAGGNAMPPVPQLRSIVDGIRMGQDTYSTLLAFCKASGDPDAIHVTVVATGDATEILRGLGSDPHCRLTDVGLGLPPDAYGLGRVAGAGRATAGDDETELDGSEVIMAVIDDGIGFANERFRLSATRTRVQYYWDMRAPPADAQTSDVVVGRALTKREIDGLLERFPNDEEEIYRRAGFIDTASDRRQPLKQRWTHGTHVLDIAAGYDYRNKDEAAIAAKRPIIAIQLPSEVIAERSDAFTAQWLKLALGKIREQAVGLAHRIAHRDGGEINYLPVVVNFSFGTFAGPHDGESAIERTIQHFIEEYRKLAGNPACEVVIPSGNGYQAQANARYEASGIDSEVELRWRIQPDDKTDSFVQIWLTEGLDDLPQQIEVALVPPGGNQSVALWSELGCATELVVSEKPIARLYHHRVPRKAGRSREQVVIAVAPTETHDAAMPCAPAGLWTIKIRKNKALPDDSVVDLRIQRDDSLMGQRPTGRQSNFEHHSYALLEEPSGRLRNDSDAEVGPVTRRGTFNSYATGLLPVVVGGYVRSNGAPALYSGSGPTTSGKPGPTLAAVADDSPVVSGVPASGTYSGSVLRQNGTSVAAPAVARALADVIAGGGNRQQFLQAVETSTAGNAGPQGPYVALDVTRHGSCRFASPVPVTRSHFAI